MKNIKTGMMAFEVTRRCNQICAHCCKGKMQNIDMSTEVINKLFKNKGYKITEMSHLAITGGEPTLVPELIEYLIDTIIELDISITSHVNYFTNGLIYDERIINSINKLMKYLRNKENCKSVELVFELSNDQFHQRPSKDVLDKYSKLSFVDKSFLKPRERTIASTINAGNAKENGLGGNKTYQDFTQDTNIQIIQDVIQVKNELLITANGNVVPVGCATFIEEDKISWGNLLETSFLTILSNKAGVMKVISLLEPWGSLIKEKVKYIETRSWKTKYRGELYIHASKKQLTNKNKEDYQEILSLLKDTDFKYGYIIAKCKLVDCVYMTEELIKKVKNNHNEYISGKYEVGRYAWILEDIEPLEKPILAKGQLSIWEYKNR